MCVQDSGRFWAWFGSNVLNDMLLVRPADKAPRGGTEAQAVAFLCARDWTSRAKDASSYDAGCVALRWVCGTTRIRSHTMHGPP